MNPTRLDSTDNPRVKSVVKLRERRARTQSQRFVVEGTREVERALDAGFVPEEVFVQPNVLTSKNLEARCRDLGAKTFHVSESVFAKLAVRESAGGIVAVFPIPRRAELSWPSSSLLLVAADIEKPGNLGALLRTADAFGVQGVLVEGGTDVWGPNVVRASLGSLFRVPLMVEEAEAIRARLGSDPGIRLVAATPDGDCTLPEVDLTGGVALAVGSEERGLSLEWIEAADVRVRIPMRTGGADSLNVSVSAAILLYEACRQRGLSP